MLATLPLAHFKGFACLQEKNYKFQIFWGMEESEETEDANL